MSLIDYCQPIQPYEIDKTQFHNETASVAIFFPEFNRAYDIYQFLSCKF